MGRSAPLVSFGAPGQGPHLAPPPQGLSPLGAESALRAGHTLLEAGRAIDAIAMLERLRQARPDWTPAYLALARALAAAERLADAAATLQRALEMDPQAPMAWLVLADVLCALDRREEADAAYMRHLAVAARHPTLLAAGQALHANDIPEAEARLRLYLNSYPTDIAAIRMLAEVAVRISRYAEAQSLLERCLELAPSFEGARHNYANLLLLRNRPTEALEQIEILLGAAPDNPGHMNLKASILVQIGDFDGAIAIYEALVAGFPGQARLWMNFGHALKSAGQEPRAIAAYRRNSLGASRLRHLRRHDIPQSLDSLPRSDRPGSRVCRVARFRRS